MASRTTQIAAEPVERPERRPVREEIGPARGVLAGLALSAILFLGILIVATAL